MPNNSVLITGAATGLGLETALHLAENGFLVYATIPRLRDRETIEAAAERRSVSVRVQELDITDLQSIRDAVRTVVDESGGIFGLVNNAGIGLRGFFEDLSEEEIRQVFHVNVFGTMAVTKAVLPHMRRDGCGRIAIVTSVGGRIGSLGVSAYCATKFALEGFGESLAQEVAPFGIQVCMVEPAITKTERWTVNRGVAKEALNQASPYAEWFRETERLVDKLVESSPTKPVHVAKAIEKAFSARRTRLRYLVGPRAKLVVALRRYLPGELFERIYFGAVIRRVTGGKVHLGKPKTNYGESP